MSESVSANTASLLVPWPPRERNSALKLIVAIGVNMDKETQVVDVAIRRPQQVTFRSSNSQLSFEKLPGFRATDTTVPVSIGIGEQLAGDLTRKEGRDRAFIQFEIAFLSGIFVPVAQFLIQSGDMPINDSFDRIGASDRENCYRRRCADGVNSSIVKYPSLSVSNSRKSRRET